MDNSNVSTFPLTPVITAFLGGVVAILMERYKSRIITLTNTISYQSLGSEISDPYWGTVSISHEGRNIRHLSFIELTIKNPTRNDAQGPLNLEVWVDGNSKILGSRGFYDTGNAILFEEKFNALYSETNKEVEEDRLQRLENPEHLMSNGLSARVNFFLTNRKLALPIFNRKSSITIYFLVENFEGVTPKLSPTIPHKGIKLIPEDDQGKIENVKKMVVGLLSVLLNVIGLIWAYNHFKGQENAITWVIVISFIAYFSSYGIYYSYIYLKRIVW